MPAIELRAARQPDMDRGQPDYHVYAGAQLVGRIYQHATKAEGEQWFWGVNSVTVDATIGRPMHGYAEDLDDAKRKLRAAFEAWLVWALAMPPADLKHKHVVRQLAAIGGDAV